MVAAGLGRLSPTGWRLAPSPSRPPGARQASRPFLMARVSPVSPARLRWAVALTPDVACPQGAELRETVVATEEGYRVGSTAKGG